MKMKEQSINKLLNMLLNKIEIIKRNNIILIEMARTMLNDKDILNLFCVEVVYITIYLFSKFLTKVVIVRLQLKLGVVRNLLQSTSGLLVVYVLIMY